MELTRQRLIMIITGATTIIIIGLYLFLYRPLISKLRVAHQKCKTIETKLLQARSEVTSLKTSETRKGLLPEEDISLAIDELTKQGKLEGLNFISMTPEETKESEVFPFKILPIKTEIESTYKGIGRFLGSLKGLEKSLVVIRDFKISPDEKNPVILKTKLTVDMCLVESRQ